MDGFLCEGVFELCFTQTDDIPFYGLAFWICWAQFFDEGIKSVIIQGSGVIGADAKVTLEGMVW